MSDTNTIHATPPDTTPQSSPPVPEDRPLTTHERVVLRAMQRALNPTQKP